MPQRILNPSEYKAVEDRVVREAPPGLTAEQFQQHLDQALLAAEQTPQTQTTGVLSPGTPTSVPTEPPKEGVFGALKTLGMGVLNMGKQALELPLGPGTPEALQRGADAFERVKAQVADAITNPQYGLIERGARLAATPLDVAGLPVTAAGNAFGQGDVGAGAVYTAASLLPSALHAVVGKPAPAAPAPELPPRLQTILAEQATAAKASPAPQAPLWTRVRTQYLDALTPAKDMVADVATRTPMTIAEDPRTTMDLVRGGIGGRIQNAFSDFKAITDEATQANVLPQLKARLNLDAYGNALDVLKDKALTDPEIAKRLEANQALPKGYNAESLASDRAALDATLTPAQATQIDSLAGRVFDLNRQALNRVHDSGIVSDATYNRLVTRNEYAPMNRIMDDALTQSGATRTAGLSLKQQTVLQNLEGSARTNIDPIEASMQRYQQAVKEAGRNDAAKAFLSLREKDPNVFGQLVQPMPPNAKPPAGYGTLAYYENGEPQRFLVPQPVADSMSFINPADAQLLGGTFLQFTRRLLQAGATSKNLAFAFRNPIRDFSDMRTLAKANVPYSPTDFASALGTWVSSLREVAQQSPAYRQMLESGGAYSTLQKAINPEHFLAGRSAPQNLVQLAVRPGVWVFDKISDLTNLTEETTKLASFKRLKASGLSDTEAAIETRRYGGSPDFAARGASEGANLALMFFSPEIRGTTRTFAALARDPLRAAKVLAGATAGIMATRAWNGQFVNPDDGKPEWNHIPEYDKQNYSIVLLPYQYQDSQGRSHFWRIEVPRGYAQQIIHQGIESTLDAVSGKESPQQAALDVAGQILPGQSLLRSNSLLPSVLQRFAAMLNPAMRVPAELLANKQFFQGTPIEPKRLEGGLPAESATAATSPALKKLTDLINSSGALGFDLRAPFVQHAITQAVPGPARMVLDLADLGSPKPPVTGAERLTRFPVFGGIARTFLGNTSDQVERDLLDQFYSALDKTGQTATSLNQLAREHPERAKALLDQPGTMQALASHQALAQIGRALGDLEQARQADSTGRSSQDQQALLAQIHKARMQLLQSAQSFFPQ